MDPLSTEALDALSSALVALLPAVNDPVLPPSLIVLPLGISQAGLGGFIGTNPDPFGDILGRRIEARVIVTSRAKDAASLDSGTTSITRAMVGDPAALRSAGIQRIQLTDPGLVSSTQAAGATQFQRDLTFQLTFEFLKVPVDAGDKIREIPIDIQLG